MYSILHPHESIPPLHKDKPTKNVHELPPIYPRNNKQILEGAKEVHRSICKFIVIP